MLKNYISASIAVGDYMTDTIQTNEFVITGLVVTGSSPVTGSQVSFLVSRDGTDFYPLFDSSGAEITLPVSGSSKAYGLKVANAAPLKPWNHVKVRLGFTGSNVLQATNVLNLILAITEE